jgi:hypothetical protein
MKLSVAGAGLLVELSPSACENGRATSQYVPLLRQVDLQTKAHKGKSRTPDDVSTRVTPAIFEVESECALLTSFWLAEGASGISWSACSKDSMLEPLNNVVVAVRNEGPTTRLRLG